MGVQLEMAVGPGKPNRAADVMLVQTLLNQQKGATPLKTDGRFGPQTAKAIATYQLTVLNRSKPDGVIDPDGATFAKLAGLPAKGPKAAKVAHRPPHVTSFIAMLLPIAREVKTKWNVPVAVLIAQAAQETGWGKHVRDNAYFGIKGRAPDGKTTSFTTHEVIDGTSKQIDDSFRAYSSLADAADDYGSFLNANTRYAGCFAYKDAPEKFVAALAVAGYATDPGYATKLTGIIRANHLTQYDQ